MRREVLRGLIDIIPESIIETVFNVFLKFVPSDKPENDELKASAFADNSIESEGTVPMVAIDWN